MINFGSRLCLDMHYFVASKLRRSKHLRKLLNEQLNYQEKEAEAEAYEEIKKNFRNNTIKFWINQGFNFIFYLITIVNLLRVTVFSSY